MISTLDLPFMIPKWAAFLLAQLLSLLRLSAPPDFHSYHTEVLNHEYDYVIVGGGSAGCLLANRLSANPEVSVLLLEAGGLEDATTEVPLYALLHFHGPLDWKYYTEPQKHSCQSMTEHRSPWPRGKVLGGTSVINFMMYVRGNKHDYDRWATEFGAKGWSYDEVLPYFKSIESFHLKAFKDNGYHGTSGELPVEYPNTHTLLSDIFLEAGKELGYDSVDYNGPKQTGFSRLQSNVMDGERWSSSRAFIKPIVEKRKNLHISLRSKATKVLFKEKEAVGVAFEREADKRTVFAKREVILSAGTIGSTQLLLLSGIGPKEHLDEVQIPLLADLPVGKNLQDHLYVGGIAATTKKSAEVKLNPVSIITEYALRREGPLAIPAAVEALAFMNTRFANSSVDFPDVEMVLLSVSPACEEGERFMLDTGLTKKVYDVFYKPRRGTHGFQIAPILNRLKSRGFIKLKSKDPDDPPIIDPLYFTHPEDIHVATEGAKTALEIMKTKAFEKLGTKLWNIEFPGCENEGEIWSDAYIRCLARHHTCTVWHPCCTCPMGSDDEHAVVDHKLRVRGGITRLRVIDTSVMPTIVTGNTNIPTHMIAEKGAAMVKEDYDPSPSGLWSLLGLGRS